MISPTGERASVWVSTWLPQLCRMPPRSLISFTSHPEYWIVSYIMGWGGAEAGRASQRALKGHGSYSLHCEVYQEAHPQAPGNALPMDFPSGPWVTPSSLGTSHASTCGQFAAHTPDGSNDSELWQIVTAGRKLAQICRPRERLQTSFNMIFGEKKRGFSSLGLVHCRTREGIQP